MVTPCVYRLLGKLDIGNRTQAALKARQLGLYRIGTYHS